MINVAQGKVSVIVDETPIKKRRRKDGKFVFTIQGYLHCVVIMEMGL